MRYVLTNISRTSVLNQIHNIKLNISFILLIFFWNCWYFVTYVTVPKVVCNNWGVKHLNKSSDSYIKQKLFYYEYEIKTLLDGIKLSGLLNSLQ